MIVKEEKPGPAVSVTIRFPPDLLAEIDSEADRAKVKRSALVLGLVRYAMEAKRRGAAIKVLVRSEV